MSELKRKKQKKIKKRQEKRGIVIKFKPLALFLKEKIKEVVMEYNKIISHKKEKSSSSPDLEEIKTVKIDFLKMHNTLLISYVSCP